MDQVQSWNYTLPSDSYIHVLYRRSHTGPKSLCIALNLFWLFINLPFGSPSNNRSSSFVNFVMTPRCPPLTDLSFQIHFIGTLIKKGRNKRDIVTSFGKRYWVPLQGICICERFRTPRWAPLVMASVSRANKSTTVLILLLPHVEYWKVSYMVSNVNYWEACAHA